MKTFLCACVLMACASPSAPQDAGFDAQSIDAGTDAGSDAAMPRPSPYLIDERGGARIFHGANFFDDTNTNSNAIRSGISTRADLEQLAALGLNFVRLTRFWHAYERTQGVIDETYIDRTIEILDSCAELQLACVIDMHQDLYAPKFGGRGFPDWSARDDGLDFTPLEPWWQRYATPAVQRVFDHFWMDDDLRALYREHWMRFVRRAAGHPGLFGYDLMNEPFAGTISYRTFEQNELHDFYQDLIDAIRAVDADSWIFVEPFAFTVNSGIAPSTLTPLAGDHIAYFPHLYDLSVDDGSPWSGNTAYIDTWESRRMREIARLQMPLLIGEFGSYGDGEGHDDYLRAILEMADRSTSGWAYWAWGWGGGWDLIRSDRTEGPLVDVVTRAYPERIAGTPTRIYYDTQDHLLEVELDDSPDAMGENVLVLPARVYPGGFDLEAETGATTMWDEARARLSVSIPRTGGHHVLRVRARP